MWKIPYEIDQSIILRNAKYEGSASEKGAEYFNTYNRKDLSRFLKARAS